MLVLRLVDGMCCSSRLLAAISQHPPPPPTSPLSHRLQVCRKYMPVDQTTVIGIDLQPIRPIPGVITHVADLTSPECRQLLKRDLQHQMLDVVLHDGAPNMGKDWTADAYSQNLLVMCTVKLATEFLRPGGTFVTKVFRSADYHALLWVFHQLFENVSATKPHSSRAQSAEIFVVCRNYKAPAKIDPRLLDPKHVFSTEGMPSSQQAPMSVLHPAAEQRRRFRDGYADDAGLLVRTTAPVMTFLRSHDPVAVLSASHVLEFDDDADEAGVTTHPATNAEVRACCTDLRLLGRADFKGLLKWRTTLRKALPELRKAPKTEDAGSLDGSAAGSDAEDDASSVDSAEQDLMEITEQMAQHARATKREKKRAEKARAKAIQRAMQGAEDTAVDLDASEGQVTRFSAATISRAARSGTGAQAMASMPEDVAAQDVDLGGAVDMEHVTPDTAAAYQAAIATLDHEGALPERERGVRAQEEDDEAYLAQLEEDADAAYERFIAKRSEAEAVRAKQALEGRVSHGIKLTRRRRMEAEAALKEAQANKALDFQHQQYLHLLAEAGKTRDETQAASDSDSDDESVSSGEFWRAREAAGSSVVDDAVAGSRDEPSLNARSARWFSRPDMAGMGDFEALDAAARAGAAAAAAGAAEPEDSDEVASGSEQALAAAGQKRRRADSGSSEDDDEGGKAALPDYLANLPKSDRDKRKEKLRKAREREARLAAKRAAEDDAALKLVPGAASDSDSDSEVDERTAARRQLIAAGLGAGAAGSLDSGKGFKVVPAGTPAGLEHDPRDEDFDAQTQAEILALGTKLRRHTTAKALVDASYNRYAFNDDSGLPAWFVQDESRNFKPQLPITKEEVDAMKSRFQDLAARPIHKVMEARARKKHRAKVKLDKARRAAASIVDDEAIGQRSKIKAIERAYSKAKIANPGKVYVVAGSSDKHGSKNKNAKVKFVDKRMKSDARGLKKAAKKKGKRR